MASQMKSLGKTSFVRTSPPASVKITRVAASRSTAFTVRAQNISRREGLTGFVVGVGVWLTSDAAHAAYGDPANVLGKTTDTSGFIPYTGEGFVVKIPSKWNPSKEREFDGVVVRYEDNGDAATNFLVISRPTEKKSISDYGSQEEFLKKTIGPLLGEQVFTGETLSEGGFRPNEVQTASLLESDETKDKNGRSYYTYNILSRSADGDEGGRHQLFAASVSDGKLLILKAQCGDKRWFKGASKDVLGLIKSFTVA